MKSYPLSTDLFPADPIGAASPQGTSGTNGNKRSGRWRKIRAYDNNNNNDGKDMTTSSINGLFAHKCPMTGGINIVGDGFKGLDNKYIEAEVGTTKGGERN